MTIASLPLVMSGDSDDALIDAARHLLAQIEPLAEEALLPFCLEQLVQPHGTLRAAVSGPDKKRLVGGLKALVEGRPARNVIKGAADIAKAPVFVFPGQGPLWSGMTRGLIDASPLFKERITFYTQALQPSLQWSPLEALTTGQEFKRLTEIQPIQFTMASALADMWRAYGITEQAVVGHSVGEAAASNAAGLLSPEEAARLTVAWGKALTHIDGQGAMISAATSLDKLKPLLARWEDRLSIAAVNSKRSVTASGSTADTDELLAFLNEEGLWAWKVPGGDVAGHSAMVDPLREEVLANAPTTVSSDTRAAYYSSVMGEQLAPEDFPADYGFRILRDTVRFADSVQALIRDGYRLFIEVSPHPILTGIIEEHLNEAGVQGAAIPTLDRRKDDAESLVQSFVHAFIYGAPIDWPHVVSSFFPKQNIDLSRLQHATPTRDATTPAINSNEAGELHQQSPDAQREYLLSLIDQETQALLGQSFSSDTQSFRDIGFTSLTVVEFARGLSAATGIELPSTLVYDYPTPRAVSDFLRHEMGLSSDDAADDAFKDRVYVDEPIAIIGMACRYPGGVTDPESLWAMIEEGRDAADHYPTDRGWDTQSLYDPEPGQHGKISTPTSNFLYDATGFDAEFFGIAPREAVTLEPQQRVLLEVAWEAIENAGINPSTLRDSLTGVYAGVMGTEYGSQIQFAPKDVAGYGYMGTATCVASGRLAYCLGLQGPAITLDTACSSSLVSIHTACEALRSSDCSLALAGGVTVMPTPGVLIDFAQQRALSPDGRCKAFSDSADGVGLSEGAGMLVLERLSQAKAHGHRILGVIRGSAVNQDGASNGLTAPSGTAQQQVIRHAWANAKVDPQDIDIVEAHGTGTRLGDPIEANALLATYGRQRQEQHPLRLGSVKSNIGHTQAAAGVAGVIKMLMAMRHGTYPRSLHITAPSSEVDWSNGSLQLLTASQPWPRPESRPRRAAVSSFGVSGTNGHLIVEEYPDERAEIASEDTTHSAPQDMFWPLSARSDEALHTAAERLRDYVQAHPEIDPVDIGYTLGMSRSHFAQRAAVWGPTRDALLTGLNALIAGQDHATLAVARRPVTQKGKLAFVFPGQGSQWPTMGMALYEAFSVYRQTIDQIDEALRPYVDWSLTDVLKAQPDAPSLERIDVVQPALFAVMVALARLWESFGLTPDAVIGHSQGEIVAAHVSGALSLQDAIKIVALRSKLMLTQAGNGAMATVGLSEADARAFIAPYGDSVSLAVFNSPSATVVSGDTEAVERLLKDCKQQRIRAKRIAVDVAGHSPRMEALRPVLMALFSDVTPQATRLPFYSTVEGYPHDEPLPGTRLDAHYWCDNLIHPVRFVDTVTALSDKANVTYLECSPHPVLIPPLEETLEEAGTALGTLRRKAPAVACLTETMARLYTDGHGISWRALHPDARIVDVPTYPFEHQYYWLNASASGDVSSTGLRADDHALLGAIVDLPDDDAIVISGRIGLSAQRWLADHAAAGVTLVPGTAYLDMVQHAADTVGCRQISELTLQAPMVLPEEGDLDLMLSIDAPDQDDLRALAVYSRPHTQSDSDPAPWALHATAQLSPHALSPVQTATPSWPPTDAQPVDIDQLEQTLAEAGYEYGPTFKGMTAAWRRGNDFFAEAQLPQGLSAEGYVIHPALLDAVLHLIALPPDTTQTHGLRLPFSFSQVALSGLPAQQLRVTLQTLSDSAVSVTVNDPHGQQLLSIGSLAVRETDPNALRSLSRYRPERDLLRLQWQPLPSSALGEPTDAPRWAVLSSQEVDGALTALPRFSDLEALANAEPPAAVIWPLPLIEDGDSARATHQLATQVIKQLQAWLAQPQWGQTPLVVITRHAEIIEEPERAQLAHSAAWGLLHSAQTENPDRFVLIDTDAPIDALGVITQALEQQRPQFALRRGKLLTPYLARTETSALLTPPADTALWHLDIPASGNLSEMAIVPAPDQAPLLDDDSVRIAIRAAGINFHDVIAALGLIPAQTRIGSEAAGVVTAIGAGVKDIQIGDRVLALAENAYGPSVIAHRRNVLPIPPSWTFAQAAGTPIAFLTAYHAFTRMATLKPGDRVLIHAAAGGVGQAAIQLAKHLGAEIFATAHPRKWPLLHSQGLAQDHIASSRTLEFAEQFEDVLGDQGIDLVLNSLSGDAVDASMGLMSPDGYFIELGKTDIRHVEAVAVIRPDINYLVLDRPDLDPVDTHHKLEELAMLIHAGALTPLPVTAFDIREAPAAFTLMQQGRHSGKVVLTLPRPLDRNGTVLITGGTGTLAGFLAHHLVSVHGIQHLLLVSRRGPDSEGAAALKERLESEGAHVTLKACDMSDRAGVEALLADIPAAHPLTGIFHTAGVLSDATIANLSEDDIDRVFAPKVDAAALLHELTHDQDLAAFVFYSSSAGVLGNPGQGNYAAANRFLDNLALNRRRQGLPATALAWGWWQTISSLASDLTSADQARIARTGFAPISEEHGNALVDAAMALPYGALAPVPLNPQTLARNAQQGSLHPLLEQLLSAGALRKARAQGQHVPTLKIELQALEASARPKHLQKAIAGVIAAILSLEDASGIALDSTFKESGIDSLMALELRNRLASATGLRLPATLTYDYPTPLELAAHLGELLSSDLEDGTDPASASTASTEDDTRIRTLLATVPIDRLRSAGLLASLLQLADDSAPDSAPLNDIDTASIDELVALAQFNNEVQAP
ncbi:SDR family NAD(P)-dependent oxidoreductase [Zymobacter sp. IVIA_5232.4 C2]|uniref:SDR family NAD(P)-dependent oxidoreductase n=1 Tax=Zymobacter sp. IVIA_5232.4 C2 TaxID=3394855 RepID=UPI0039C0BA07